MSESLESVGPWAEEKHRLVSMYAGVFSKSMRGKWGERVYIDLYCGPGLVKNRVTGQSQENSALRALKSKTPFDRYIFSDISEKNVEALKKQAEQLGLLDRCDFLCGDAKETALKVVDLIKKKKTSSICFCVLDPYNIQDFNFNTIKILSQLKIDFLVLIASFMDAHRNEVRYLDAANAKLEEFFSDPNWREMWPLSKLRTFGGFISKHFCAQMTKLGFLDSSDNIKLIRNTGTQAPLYHLAFFSKNKLGLKFWKEAKKYSNDQVEMDFGLTDV